MTGVLRVGTRGSPLALRQTELVLAPVRRRNPRVRFEVVTYRTDGDRRTTARTGLDFTDRLDRALEKGEVDLTIHSAKDLPSAPIRPVEIQCTPPRADPRDALVLRAGRSLRRLPTGATLGSSSARRRAQLAAARPDLRIEEVRGNVGTRLERLDRGRAEWAGLVLAVAGLSRLGFAERITERLPLSRFLPSPGQAVIAVEARVGDRRVAGVLRAAHDEATFRALTTERSFLTALGADCENAVGAWARARNGRLTAAGIVLAPDGSRSLRATVEGSLADPTALGRRLARTLLSRGAARLLETS